MVKGSCSDKNKIWSSNIWLPLWEFSIPLHKVNTWQSFTDRKNTCMGNTVSKWPATANHDFLCWEYKEAELYIKYVNMHLLFDVSEKIFWENTGFGGSGCLVVCGFGGSFLRGFFCRDGERKWVLLARCNAKQLHLPHASAWIQTQKDTEITDLFRESSF